MTAKNAVALITRRQFVRRVTLVAGVAPVLSALPALAAARSADSPNAARTGLAPELPTAAQPPAGAAVVSFHVDQLYLDKSGTAAPYLPPAGVRSGQAAAELSDEEFLSRHAYF